MARAGDDLSGCHRVGGGQDEKSAYDKVAPQRRGLARDAASEAPRAAARVVQGRSARAGADTRPAARAGLPSPVSGSGPGRTHPRRGDARAHWAPLPHDLLARVSTRITNEVRGINRVVYDISGKPPATIEWE